MPTKSKRRSSMSSREEERILDEYRRRFEDRVRKVKIHQTYEKPPVPVSPYLQSVAPRNASVLGKNVAKRPQSAQRMRKPREKRVTSFGSVKSHSTSVTSKSLDDMDGYSSSFESSDSEQNEKENQPAGGHQELKPLRSILRHRPSSAPIHKRRHTHEGTVETDSVKSDRRKDVPVFKRHNIMIRCTAYKNGSRENGVTLVASDVKLLLIEATRKLGLNTAARRVYLPDGSEAFRPGDIPHNADVFISCGEQFKDPKRVLNNSGSLIASNSWTMKGVVLESERKPVRRNLSHRLRHLAEKQSSRILVFQNGDGCDGQEIVIVNTDGYPRLLDLCTTKLKLNMAARTTYGWDGKEVSSLNEVRLLDSSMKNGATLILGPIWVSSGEGFSPQGALNFVEGILWGLNQRLEVAKIRSEQLDHACNGDMSQVTHGDIAAMSMDDIYTNIDQVSEEIEDMKRAKKKYKEREKVLKDMVQQQKEKGTSYTMKHIKEIKSDDRIVGQHGLRLEIFENGRDSNGQMVYVNMREILRGTKDEQTDHLIRMRFLEHLSHWHKPLDPTGPAKKTMVQKMFDQDGNEIQDIQKIENEQKIWLSYGEDFKPLDKMSLQVQLEPVLGLLLKGKDEVIMRRGGEVELSADTKWEACIGFPNCYDFMRVEKLEEVVTYSTRDHYLQDKNDRQSVAMPTVVAGRKQERSSQQAWIIHRNGTITSRGYPQLALSLDDDRPITAELPDGSTVEGYAVMLQKKSRGNMAQCWEFSPSGQICTLYSSSVTQVLTYLHQDHFTNIEVKGRKAKPGEVTLAVLEKVSGPRAKFQRWALKQERVPNQWKRTKVTNPVWKKLAYSWPVLPDGNWNMEYQWPMDGMFLNAPPPLRGQGSKSETSTTVPLRVYRNGEKNPKRFASVVVPDLSASTLAKDRNEQEAEGNVEKLELNMFLEQATSLLNLPFAARRLFNDHGVEIFTLRKLKRNQVVYVTCGETWHNPTVTKTEAQRRQLLSKLSADVRKIHEYCTLRDPGDVVMAMESGPVAGSRLIVTQQITIVREEDKKEKEVESEEKEKPASEMTEEKKEKSAHEQAHERSDRWAMSRRYPWQQQGYDIREEEPPEIKSPRSARSSQRSPRAVQKDPMLLQKFNFKDGFLTPDVDPTLAVGVSGVDLEAIGGAVEVRLCSKNKDDPAQRWELRSEDGLIRLACNPSMGLAVCLPTFKNDEEPSARNYTVVLQKLRPHTAGTANQRWHWDVDDHVLKAFSSSVTDKEVTAANHLSVCTHAIRGPVPMNQDGFVVEKSGRAPSNPVVVCQSCATVLRGQYSLTRVPAHWSFACAMGNARKNGLKLRGSFRCLNGKVDLSTYEAEPTLTHWMRQLQRLRQETSMRSINRDIKAAECTQAWRLLARRNGEGYRSKPEMMVGSSVVGILDQCSHKLGLSSAARRLYTEDGTQILHMDQLREWVLKVNKDVRQPRPVPTVLPQSETESGAEEKEGGNGVDAKIDKTNDGTNSTEGTPDHSTAEFGTQDLTRRRGKKVSETSQPTSTNVQPEMLALPVVEVWVSCGENFINPVAADKMSQENLVIQAERNAKNLVADTQRHVIRQIHGRRRGQMNPRELVPTRDSRHPVVVSGGWEEKTREEDERQMLIKQMKDTRRAKRPTSAPRLQSHIYRQPQMKRIVARAIDDPSTSVYAWGNSLETLLDDASTRLGLRKPARIFRTSEGRKIRSFDEIERNSELYINPNRPGSTIRMKTVWARTRKAHGPESTEIVLSSPRSEKSLSYVPPTNGYHESRPSSPSSSDSDSDAGN